MKKKILMYVVLTILAFACVGCAKKDDSDKSSSSGSSKSKYEDFMDKVVDKDWYRSVPGCYEHVIFEKSGMCSADEACGLGRVLLGPFSEWEYDKKNDNVIIMTEHECIECEDPKNCDIPKVTTMTIEFVSCDGDTLVMIIDGEERTFKSNETFEGFGEMHSLTVTIVTKGGEFMTYIEGNDWIQADGSGTKISFKWNAETENSEFRYITSSGETVEGFELFDIYEYEGEAKLDEKMNVILYNSNGEETKTIVYVGYIDEKLVLEIDGKEVTFTRE